MKNFSDFFVFLRIVLDELRLTKKKERRRRRRKKKNKMTIFAAGFLGRKKGQENFEGNFALYTRSSLV